jgi:filamentous hemagglutinin family protein
MRLINKFWLFLILPTLPVQGQINPDQTLPTSTQITQQNNIINIQQGTEKGNNLFHSFDRFSVPEGMTAYFHNNANIQNIFSRVTGGEISQINGTIKANGNANLLLMNPQGILFGKNASLQIGGSFLATTANSIKFADNFEFIASNQQNKPLLTVSVPVGLQFNQPNSGEITVNGNGHNLNYSYPTLFAVQKSSNSSGLKVEKGQNLALVGGNINFIGGNLEAPEGSIIVASIGQGYINLNDFDMTGVSTFKDINVTEKSSLETIGNGGGNIFVAGNNINLKDGSLIFIQNNGDKKAGNMNINSNQLLIDGLDSNHQVRSLINNENIGNGLGGNLNINTNKLLLQNGGTVQTLNFGLNQAGDININAYDSINVNGYNSFRPHLFSVITASTYSPGYAGNINIFSPIININDGGAIASATFLSQGNSGNITINSKDILLTGFIPEISQPTVISTSSFSQGNAGNLLINTDNLTLKNNGLILSSTFAQGNAGSIDINATNSVKIEGSSLSDRHNLLTEISYFINQFNRGNLTIDNAIDILGNLFSQENSLLTGISSANQIINPELRVLYQVPAFPMGSLSNITINTKLFSLENQAVINVSNISQSSGSNPGRVKIMADTMILNQSAIAGFTLAREGGDIILDINKLLLLRNGSLINANALKQGSGGNIKISSPFIIAVPSENSDIIANAFLGKGGNIDLTSQGIFGIQYSSKLNDFSEINASSELGLDGVVIINTPGIEPNLGMIKLPSTLVDISTLIANKCHNNNNQNSFVITGKGGLPDTPLQSLNDHSSLGDFSNFSSRNIRTKIKDNFLTSQTYLPQLVEAKKWIVNEKNQVVLTNDFPDGFHDNYSFACGNADK